MVAVPLATPVQRHQQQVRPGQPRQGRILAAKITAPGVPDSALPRPRITKLIAHGTRWCPLTVLTAPAGAGKTTALALWAAAEPRTVAWVSADEFDSGPGVFWAYVIAALRRSGAAVPTTLPAAHGPEAGHVFLLGLAAALAALDPPVTLVLDDLHLLTDPEVLEGLDYLLRNAGAGLRLAVSARADPPLPVDRYRLSGELTEIRACDLAFTSAEAGLLLARHGCTLPADSLECLTRRTEGWGGRPAPGRALDGHPSRPWPGRHRADHRGQRRDRLPGRGGSQHPAACGPGRAAEHQSVLERVSAEAAIELAGNEQGQNPDSPWRTRTGSSSRSGPGGTAPTRCSRKCCA